MPTRHGFTVNVASVDGELFTEYGDQNIGTRNASRMVSCKIRAVDGQKFYIHIKSEYPFPYEGQSNPGLSEEKSGGGRRNDARYNLRQRKAANGGTSDEDRMDLEQETPAYIFAYWVYIEGNEKPECGGFLNVDNPPHNPAILKGRYSAPKGRTASKVDIHEWQFSSRGIDVLLSNMDIAADAEAPDMLQQEVEEVTKALGNLTPTKTRRSPGQIEVRLVRIVVVGTPAIAKPTWQRDEDEHNSPSHDNDGTDCHPITVDRRPQYTQKLIPTTWRLYDLNETCYARFTFQAMDLPKLVQLNLATADGKKQQRLKVAEKGLTTLQASSGTPLKHRLKHHDPDEHEEINAKGGDKNWSSDEDSGESDDEDSSSDDEPRAHKRRGGNNNLAVAKLKAGRSKEPSQNTRMAVQDSKKLGITANEDTKSDNSWMQMVRAPKNDENGKGHAGFDFQIVKSNDMPAEAEQGELQLVKTGQGKAKEAENGHGKLGLVKVDDGEIEQHGEEQVIW